MFELRWTVPTGTTTNPPVLQWRQVIGTTVMGNRVYERWSAWTTVPTVVVNDKKPTEAE
jgi:hypothetical protein